MTAALLKHHKLHPQKHVFLYTLFNEAPPSLVVFVVLGNGAIPITFGKILCNLHSQSLCKCTKNAVFHLKPTKSKKQRSRPAAAPELNTAELDVRLNVMFVDIQEPSADVWIIQKEL